MSLQVKICGITRLSDAEAAVVAGADALGFMFYPPSPRNISTGQARDIIRQLPARIQKIGVFVDADTDTISRAVAASGLTGIQLHGSESPAFCGGFPGITVWKAFRVRDAASLDMIGNYTTDAWLLDSYVAGIPGGSGERFNWDLAIQAGRHGRPVILAGGLTPENVGEAIRTVKPAGVDVSSGVENRPGEKDPEKIRRFLAAARGA